MSWNIVNPNMTNDPSYLQPQLNDLSSKVTNNTTQLAQKASQTDFANLQSKYGIVADGVADDTVALQNAINDAISNRMKLYLHGKIRITTEILINQTVWIEGVGNDIPVGSDYTTSGTQIILDSSDPTKCAFRINTAQYKGQGIKLKNLFFKANQQTANQHAIIVQSGLSYGDIENIEFYQFAGYGIYFDTANSYTQNLYLRNIHFINLGGCIGQSGTVSTPLVTLAILDNLNLDGSINSTSPQNIVYDLQGWRWVSIRSMLAEGTLPSNIPTGFTVFRFGVNNDNGNITADNLWGEFPGTYQPTYLLNVVGGTCIIRGLEGLGSDTSHSKIKIANILTDVQIYHTGNSNQLAPSDYVESDSLASITFHNFHTYSQTPSIAPNKAMLGKMNVERIIQYYGSSQVKASQKKNLYIYQLQGYLTANRFVTPPNAGAYHFNQEYLSVSSDGRCITCVNTAGNDIPYLYMTFNIPSEYVGSTVIIAMRYYIETTDLTSTVNMFYNSLPNTRVLNSGALNAWTDGYLIINNAPSSFIVQTSNNNPTAQHKLHIADYQVVIGDEMPILQSMYNNSAIETKWNAIPTQGTYILGDIIKNTAPTASGSIGWVCTGSGTFGTLSGVTGSITSGANSLTVSDASSLKVGQYITITGVTGTFYITAINGTTVTLSANAGATVSGATVNWQAPVLKTYGTISA